MPELPRGSWADSKVKLAKNYCATQNAIFPEAWGKISLSLLDQAENIRREPYGIVTGDALLTKIIGYQDLQEEKSDTRKCNEKTYKTWVDMPGLLHCCSILFEGNAHQICNKIHPNQVNGQSMLLQSALEAITATGERILRIMVFDESFWKKVIGMLKEAYASFLSYKAGADGAKQLPWISTPERPPLVIVAALIIFVNIGLQASHFVAGEKMAKCTSRWQTIYVA